ncbi:hypothetical protein G443_004605 [Actinoalloteichus cyanogriseus DSM 43889]|uniref:Septum formation initiator n=1 Tax=Actinoalloteichus caeruleus DSM 43889 TaxID=1120930 RepID=A0ABT1JP83_ACTCY|nr:hypothetical protein [Actinoalloteichus caeruleus DSM 43889]
MVRKGLSNRTRFALGAAGWAAGATAATAVGIAAVGAIGAGIVDDAPRVLDQQAISSRLTSQTANQPAPSTAPAVPSTSAESGPGEDSEPVDTGPPPQRKVIGTPGGSLAVECVGDQARLVSWTPDQGFHVDADDVERGPAREVSLEFESEDVDIEVDVVCQGGVPAAYFEED